MTRELVFREYDVEGLSSLHGVLRGKRRAGIYILHFANGERYVGRSVDVIRRFREHCRYSGFTDTVAVEFAPCARRDLASCESRTISQQRAQGFTIRNVVGTPGRLGTARIDELVTPEEQEAWRTTGVAPIDDETRVDDKSSRAAGRERFRLLTLVPEFDAVTALLREYVGSAIPAPRATERDFWTVSAMPATNRSSTHQRIAAINVNSPETLVLYVDHGELGGFLNVSLSALSDSMTIADLAAMLVVTGSDFRLPGIYASAGGDDCGFEGSIDQLRAVLAVSEVQRAAREYVLNLLRKGGTIHARNHNYQLADLLLDDTAGPAA